MTPVSVWTSVLRSQKAIRAGLAALIAYTTALLVANPNPTWKEYLGGIPAYLITHYFVYSGTNLNTNPGVQIDVPVAVVPVAADPALDLELDAPVEDRFADRENTA